jgi:hypothetical protein
MRSRRIILLASCAALAAMMPSIGLAAKTIAQIKTEPRADQLKSLLDDQYYSDFLAFSKKNLMDENVAFLYAVAHKQDSKTIYNRYIAKGAAKQVNLPPDIVAALAKNAAPNKWERMDFGPAETEISKLLVKQKGGNDIIANFITAKAGGAAAPAPGKKAGKK